jgi:beta-lactamase regulating signal transducer with metallopeptidase domain
MIDSWIGLSESLVDESCLRFALTLLHFLWQGAVIGALVAAAVWILRRSPPSSRYTLHSAALVCLPVCIVVTFATVEVPRHWMAPNRVDGFASLSADNELAQSNELIAIDSPTESENGTQRSGEEPQPVPLDQAVERANTKGPAHASTSTHPETRPFFVRLAPAVAAIYFAGVSLFLLRLMAATWGGHRLRTASTPIDDPSLLMLVVDQSRQVGLRLAPTVAYCERVAVPMAVGVLRPVVLLPASLMTGLDPEQFAAIISHELAHIRRYDLLMNLIQRLIESLLFFHPVVWYISRRMSAERESCCDDLVVSSGYDPMDYAGALLQMAERCSPTGQPDAVAVAAFEPNVSQFEVRIQRLMNGSRGSQLRLTRVGVLMIALLVCSIAATPALVRNRAHAQSETTPSESNERSQDESQKPETETAPKVADSPSSLWPARLSGVVRDMDGSGIAGAKVQLTITEFFREGTDDGERALKTVQTTDDQNGEYTVTTEDWPVPSAERSFSVRCTASAPGHAPWQTWFFNRAGYRKVRDSLPELKLPRGKEITGRCVDGSGDPVVGATIRGQTAFDQPGCWQRPHDPTDQDGRFRVMVPKGYDAALWIVSDTEGHEQVEIPAAHDGPLHVVMRGGTSLIGQVESLSGEPVAETLVVLEQSQVDRRYKYATVLRFAAKTDEQGRFRMPPTRGTFRCFLAQASRSDERAADDSVFAGRAAPPLATVMVSLDGKGSHKEIILRESKTVRLGGTVRLEDGRPVEGCPIRVYCNHAKIDQLVSDKDGQYSTNVPASQQEFIITTTNVTNHHSLAAPHSPGEHQGYFITLKGITEDITNADYVFVSRHKNVQQPAKTSESVRFWEDLVNTPKQEPQPTDGASKASEPEKGETRKADTGPKGS